MMTGIAVLVHRTIVQRRSRLMPDAEVSRRGRRATRWLLALRTRSAGEDIRDHEPGRPVRRRRRRVTGTIVVIVITSAVSTVIVIVRGTGNGSTGGV